VALIGRNRGILGGCRISGTGVGESRKLLGGCIRRFCQFIRIDICNILFRASFIKIENKIYDYLIFSENKY
jgi:hypothetical protein